VSEPLTSHALAFRDATNTAWSVGAYLEDGTFTPHTVLFTLDTSTGEVTGATDFAGLSPSPEGLRWF
jgi:hypothetical protein